MRSEVLGHESVEPHAGGVIGEEDAEAPKPHHVMDRHRERPSSVEVHARLAELSLPQKEEGHTVGRAEPSHSQCVGQRVLRRACERSKRHERHCAASLLRRRTRLRKMGRESLAQMRSASPCQVKRQRYNGYECVPFQCKRSAAPTSSRLWCDNYPVW